MTPRERAVFKRLVAQVRAFGVASGEHLSMRWPLAHRGNCGAVYQRGEYVGPHCAPGCVAWQQLLADAEQVIEDEPTQLALLEAAS